MNNGKKNDVTVLLLALNETLLESIDSACSPHTESLIISTLSTIRKILPEKDIELEGVLLHTLLLLDTGPYLSGSRIRSLVCYLKESILINISSRSREYERAEEHKGVYQSRFRKMFMDNALRDTTQGGDAP